MTAPVPVALLGAGPIGLATAILLARAGFAATLFDARPLEAARGDRRLLALSRGSWQVLRPLLGTEAARLRSAPIVDVHVSSAGEFGTTLLRARDLDPRHAEPLGATVYYGDLVTALAAAAALEPGVAVRRPVSVSAVTTGISSVELTLQPEGTAGAASERVSAALAVHAEGSPPADPSAPQDWAVLAELQLAGVADAGAAFERFTRDGPLALLPTPPAPESPGPRWSLVWCMNETAAQRRGSLGDAAFMADLQQAIGPRIAQLRTVSPRRVVPLPQAARERVVEQRSVWIGNAAQTLHPVAGQGLNLGLRDALTLVDCLVAQRADLPKALADYARRRRADRALVRTVTRWMPSLFATRAAPVALARSAGLTAMDLLPPLRREWARLLMFGVRN